MKYYYISRRDETRVAPRPTDKHDCMKDPCWQSAVGYRAGSFVQALWQGSWARRHTSIPCTLYASAAMFNQSVTEYSAGDASHEGGRVLPTPRN